LKEIPLDVDYPQKMLNALIDHLWQSIAFAALVYLLAFLTRRGSAALRLWLWRIAALKFLVPFALLYTLGGWFGFPVRHSAVPPPTVVTELVSRGLSIAAPATTFEFSSSWAAGGLVLALASTGLCLAGILREIRRAQKCRSAEAARAEADWSQRPAPPGFLQSALLAAVAICAVSFPIIAGASRDRLWRQQVLVVDEQALRSALIAMNEAPESNHAASRVTASSDGVLISNITLKDLVSLVYGIGKFEVFGGAMPWLEYPRYDVRVAGPLRAPEVFDPYSLREPMTNYLYEQFGVSIRVNGTCQKPCKDHESFVIERLPRCTRLLGAHPECG
jgi:hypothetical protein